MTGEATDNEITPQSPSSQPEAQKAAQFSVSQGAPMLLTITDPDDGLQRQHVVAVNILQVVKTGALPNGEPAYDFQLSFAIGPVAPK